MSKRLKDVVDRLYHPPKAGVRQVIALSRADAEKLPRLPAVAMISITAPDKPFAAVDGFEHLLRLSFADVDFLNPGLSKRSRQKIANAFTPEQGMLVHDFLGGLPDEVRSVLVHCEGGYSRSCAIALALQQIYGYVAEMERLSEANPSVLKVMLMTRRSGES